MYIATLITLTLVTILLLSVGFLFSFSYDTFIPRGMGFGKNLYLALIFFIYLVRETYFSYVKHSPSKRFNYIYIPIVFNTVIGFIIIFNFEFPFGSAGSDMPTGQWLVELIVYGMMFAVVAGVNGLLMMSSMVRYKSFYENINPTKYIIPFNSVVKRSSSLLIPVLVALIGYILFLAYSDYSSMGMKRSYTHNSNIGVMYKSANNNQNITFCDHIINTWDNEYSTERCYANFFEKVKVIEQLKSKGKYNDLRPKDFFNLYNGLKTSQCNKSKKSILCEDLLLKETYTILEKTSEGKIIFADKIQRKSPKYLAITVENYWVYKEIHSFLEKDLEEFKPRSIAFIKKVYKNNEFSTRIYIDIKKLADNESDLFAIYKKIKMRKISLKEIFTQKNRTQDKKNRLMRKKEILKYETEIRKNYHLTPSDQIKVCKDMKYFKCDCAKPMCVSGMFVYYEYQKGMNFPMTSSFGLKSSASPSAQCFSRIQSGEVLCKNISAKVHIRP